MKKYFIGLGTGLLLFAIIFLFLISNIALYGKIMFTLQRNYNGEIDSDYMTESIISGMVNGLDDPHSSYIYSSEIDQFYQSLDTSYEGIGVMINTNTQTGVATVTEVIPTGPAANHDIYAGDQITSVNGVEITEENVLDTATMIKENDTVDLVLYRPSEDTYIEETITLDVYMQPTVYGKMIEDDQYNIGFIKITSFSNTTAEEFEEVLISLEENNLDALIIDVRNNGGGQLESVVAICDLIINNDRPYLYTKSDGEVERTYQSTLEEPKEYEIIGLQNQGTASASEILTSALKEVNGSEIVGTTSYGKGSVQRIYPIPLTGGSMKITIEHWYSADDNLIDGAGVEPTIYVEDEMTVVRPIILEEKLMIDTHGQQVEQVNQYLYYLGYDVTKGNIYTEETEQAVREFQKDNGLEETGVVDYITADVLYNEAKYEVFSYENDPYIKAAVDSLGE